MIYFLIISILTLLGKISEPMQKILLTILLALQFIFFVVRNSLEIDAMTRAENLSKEYISQENILSKENEERLMNKYKELNKIGIKTYNFMLKIKIIIKQLF